MTTQCAGAQGQLPPSVQLPLKRRRRRIRSLGLGPGGRGRRRDRQLPSSLAVLLITAAQFKAMPLPSTIHPPPPRSLDFEARMPATVAVK